MHKNARFFCMWEFIFYIRISKKSRDNFTSVKIIKAKVFW